MRVSSHPDADQELEGTAFFYEERSEGLGDDFLDEFEYTLTRIITNPTRYHLIRGHVRQLRFRRFPFSVVYELHQGAVYVLAVSHVRRRPFYWRYRRQ